MEAATLVLLKVHFKYQENVPNNQGHGSIREIEPSPVSGQATLLGNWGRCVVRVKSLLCPQPRFIASDNSGRDRSKWLTQLIKHGTPTFPLNVYKMCSDSRTLHAFLMGNTCAPRWCATCSWIPSLVQGHALRAPQHSARPSAGCAWTGGRATCHTGARCRMDWGAQVL